MCRSLELGGLGIHNLEVLGWSLRMCWLWLQKTQSEHPWVTLGIVVHANVRALYAMSMVSVVGDGRTTLYWSD